jgi:hypothetical protein
MASVNSRAHLKWEIPAEVCELDLKNGERSRRRVRDLVTQLAFEGRSQNETERARISMMARSDLLHARAGYRSARPVAAAQQIQLATHGRSFKKIGRQLGQPYFGRRFSIGRSTSSYVGTWVLSDHDSSAAPQTVQIASPGPSIFQPGTLPQSNHYSHGSGSRRRITFANSSPEKLSLSKLSSGLPRLLFAPRRCQAFPRL